ncbi:hypothetical protein O6H91_04G060200 [Diphasiastrum complanatum]|uniref:Uncharacterized protein n=1 Tax=Diphasiastrum complanatum TaxID=34168 RepID=A0ACC2DX54_DIPCM|nr:hypothetical protein O6H91_04G060200 [Diphasiastrum complanatum]
MLMSTDKWCRLAFLLFLLLFLSHSECIRARVLNAGGAIDAVSGVAGKHVNRGIPDKLVLFPEDKLVLNRLPKGHTRGSGPNPRNN